MTIDITIPLQYECCDNAGTAFQIHDGKRQIAIVEVADLKDIQPCYEDIPIGEAYAKLFRASPHLLNALKTAITVMQDHELDTKLAGEFEMLTDVIAMAEGEADADIRD